MTQFDLVVMGAGLVGASLYHGLAFARAQGLRVLVVDTASHDASSANYSPSFDDRSTAISLGSKHILDDYQLWSDMASSACPIEQIEVSETANLGYCQLNSKQQKVAAFGYVVPNKALGRALMSGAAHNVDFKFATQIKGIQFDADHAILQLLNADGESEIRCKLVVLAEGGRSDLHQRLGFTQQTQSYQQSALIFNVEMSKPQANVAFERFTTAGPVAFLPLVQPGHYAVVFTVDEQAKTAFMAMDFNQRCDAIYQRIGYRLGRVLTLGDIASYPLVKRIANEQVRSRIVLCGNSAVSLHPVAGQGFNLALRCADTLARHITREFEQQRDIGELNALQCYEQSVIADQQNTADFSHYLTQLFAVDNSLLKVGRGMGLYQLNKHEIAKSLFSQFSMGVL